MVGADVCRLDFDLGVTWGVLSYIFMWPPVVTQYVARGGTVACQNNLRAIDAAIDQFAVEHNKHAGDPVSWDDLKPYIKLNSKGEIPGCPIGGKYTITVVGAKPTCSYILNTKIRVGLFQYKCDSIPHVLP